MIVSPRSCIQLWYFWCTGTYTIFNFYYIAFLVHSSTYSHWRGSFLSFFPFLNWFSCKKCFRLIQNSHQCEYTDIDIWIYYPNDDVMSIGPLEIKFNEICNPLLEFFYNNRVTWLYNTIFKYVQVTISQSTQLGNTLISYITLTLWDYTHTLHSCFPIWLFLYERVATTSMEYDSTKSKIVWKEQQQAKFRSCVKTWIKARNQQKFSLHYTKRIHPLPFKNIKLKVGHHTGGKWFITSLNTTRRTSC